MTKHELLSNDEVRTLVFRVQCFFNRSLFVFRISSFLLLSILAPALQAADNISVLGSKPRWNVLEHYQRTITHDEFARLVNNVYATHGFAPDLIEIKDDTARILINRD